jgi:hypothetical protein
MKTAIFLFCLLVLLSSMYAKAALPPTSAAGQADTSKITTFNFQVPNKLATNVGGATLLENGNNNILTNPSFEHTTVSTGWTCSPSPIAETTVVVHGKKSVVIAPSAATMSCVQDSTLYQAQFADGVQGLAMVRVKTSVSGIKVCSRQAGTTSTTNCVDVVANGLWGLYKVPMILGATSNGIAVHSNSASVTGNIYIDDAFVGAVDLKADVNGASFFGSLSYAATTGCSWSVTSTSYTSFAADTDCPTPTASGRVQTPATKIPAFVIPAGSPSGNYQINAKALFYNNGGPASTSWRLTDGTNTTAPSVHNAPSASGKGETIFNYRYTTSSTATTVQFQCQASSGICFIFSDDSYRNLVFDVYYYPENLSVYTSTNADTDWAACNFSSLAWQGLGTVTNNLKCKRQGSDLLMMGNIVTGVVSGSLAQFMLPTWNGVQLTTSSSVVGSNYLPGRLSRGESTVATDLSVILVAGQSYFNYGLHGYTAASNPITPINGNTALNNSTVVAFESVRIPIAGWTNSNLIIGQFNEVVTTPGTNKTVIVSADISTTGIVTAEDNDFINGSCAKTGASSEVTTCTFTTSYWSAAPKCWAHGTSDPGGAQSQGGLATQTQIALTGRIGGSTAYNGAFTLFCKGTKP